MTIQRNDLPAGLRVSRLNRAVFISVLRHMLGLKKKKLAVKPFLHYSYHADLFNSISVKPPKCSHDLSIRVKLREALPFFITKPPSVPF